MNGCSLIFCICLIILMMRCGSLEKPKKMANVLLQEVALVLIGANVTLERGDVSPFCLIRILDWQFNVKTIWFDILALSAFLPNLKCKIRSRFCINEGSSLSFYDHNLLTHYWGLKLAPYSRVLANLVRRTCWRKTIFGILWCFSWRKVLQLGFAWLFLDEL